MIPIPFDILENKPNIRAFILVVEDEALVRMMLMDVLDDAGFKVMEAAHADEALHILAAAPDVQVVVTDVEMPRGSINGFELARRVRDDRQDIGVVIASGRVTPALGDLPEGPISSKSPFVLKDCLSWSERCSVRAESATGERS